MKPYQVARLLRQTASRITTMDVLTSGNPKRMVRYLWNRVVGAEIRKATRRLFMKGK